MPSLIYVTNLSQYLRPFRKNSLIITLEDAFEVLDDDKYLFDRLTSGTLGFGRSLPEQEELQGRPATAQFLREVLATGRSIDELSNKELNYCYRRGWLQAELELSNKDETELSDKGKTNKYRTVYVFPSRIHQR